MTVTYLKDGRIEVKDAHDALLLSLAGIELYSQYEDDEEPTRFIFKEHGWYQEDRPLEWGSSMICYQGFPETLYVPADVARGLVWVTPSGRAVWNAGKHERIKYLEVLRNDEVYLIKHNDRWNLLPEIEMEK